MNGLSSSVDKQRFIVDVSLIPQSHLLYGGRTVAVELQNRVIPAVAVEILRWPQGHRTANPYVLQAAGVAVEL